MSDFNDIGISRQLDLPRIKKLLSIGLFASALHLCGDMLLGWGVENEALTGLERMISAYTGTSDGKIFAAALLGLFAMTLEGFSYFGVYRLIAERAPDYAHKYRSGIFGYLIFGACGYHVPVCALVFLTKHGLAQELLMKYAEYFILPAFILFWVFFLVLEVTHIKAFAKGLTPYPKWCFVFSLPIGMAAAMLPSFFGNFEFFNALSCAWIAVGNLWQFGGLLATFGKIKEKQMA